MNKQRNKVLKNKNSILGLKKFFYKKNKNLKNLKFLKILFSNTKT
jgi:hypothetical protein